MPERFDFFADRQPAPSLAELREGITLLLDCHGTIQRKPSIAGHPQQAERIVALGYGKMENGVDSQTVFFSECLADGCMRVESYVAYEEPLDGSIRYVREWIIDLSDEPSIFWKRETARHTLYAWEGIEAQKAASNL